MKRLTWSEKTFEAVAKETVKVLCGHIPPSKIKNSDLIRAFKLGQQVLPIELQKTITGVHHIKVSMPYLRTALEKKVKELGCTKIFNFDSITFAPVKIYSVKKYNSNVENILNVEKIVAKTVEKFVNVEKCSELSAIPATTIERAVTNLFEAFAEAIAAKVSEKLAVTLDSKILDLQELIKSLKSDTVVPVKLVPVKVDVKKHNPSPFSTGRIHALSIGVMGLLPVQQKTVSQTYVDEPINFRFYDQFPKQQPPSVDHMIGMIGFMSHSNDAKAISHYGIRYHRSSNGVTSLLVMIDELLSKFKGEYHEIEK